MNFTLSCPCGSSLDNIHFEINCWRKNRQEKKQRYQKRLSISISDMKYLDKVILVDGCTYRIENLEKKTFPSLLAALEYCRNLHPDKVKMVFGNSIRIFIDNPKGLDSLDESLIPPGLLVRNCKDALCIYAKERVITVAADMSEVYTEFFDLPKSEYSSSDNIFDYGLLYGGYPVYTGTELCLSKLAEPGENVPFVPEISTSISNPSSVYDHVMDVHLAYHCWYACMEEEGSVYDDHDGAYPLVAVPVSTFVNIGKAGVYWPCWEQIIDETHWHELQFIVGGAKHNLFRFALLTCKSQEVSAGQAYYQMTVSYDNADGLLPTDAAGLSLRNSRQKLILHAKERTVYISPSFDAVYWETFELQDDNGQIFCFCFDYAMLEAEHPEIVAGNTYQTSYWSKAQWGNSLANVKVTICTLTDPNEIYSGQGGITLCCECSLKDDPNTVQRVPVSTLTAQESEPQ